MDNQDYWNGVERRKPVRNDVVAIAFKAGMERAAEIARKIEYYEYDPDVSIADAILEEAKK